MKTKRIVRSFLVSLLILALILPLGRLSAAALSPEDLKEAAGESLPSGLHAYSDHSAQDATIPVFYAATKNENNQLVMSVAVTCADSQGNVYLIANAALKPYLDQGIPCVLMGDQEYTESAEYLGSDDHFVYLDAPGIQSFRLLPLVPSDSSQLMAVIPNLTEEGIQKFSFLELELDSTWKDNGTGYESENLQVGDMLLGAPMLDKNHISRIAGILTKTQDGRALILRAEHMNLNSAYAIGHFDTGEPTQPQEEKPQAQVPEAPAEPPQVPEAPAEPSQQSKPEKKGTVDTKVILIVLAVAAAAFFVYKKQKGKKPSQPEVRPEPESTAHLEPTHPVETGIPAMQAFRIRGISGPLAGQTYPLAGTMRLGRSHSCDVRFPEGTPGVSGVHCELTVSGDQVLLRDLNSSYGTFLQGGRRAVSAQTYPLHCGDVFTLADNGPAFCLEQEGSRGGYDFQVKDLTTGQTCQGRDQMTFGRNGQNNVVLTDTAVSGSHCILYRQDGKLYLADKSSTNGTFLQSGERLAPNTPREVRRGDRFYLAAPRCSYEITEA